MDYLSEIEQTRGKLKPFVDFIENLDKAIAQERQLRTTSSSYTQAIPTLKEEVDLLVAEKNQLLKEVESAKHVHGETMRKQSESSQRDAQELKGKIDVMKANLVEAENAYRVRMAQMESKYNARMEELGKQVTAEEKRLVTIQGGIAAAKAAMEKL